MTRYMVTLTHNEMIEVEANNENEAVYKAYAQAEANCVWDEVDVEELEDEEQDL